MNVPRIKGSHNAMLSGMMAAKAAFAALRDGRSRDVLDAYEQSLKQSSMATELKKVRNVKPLWSRLGTRLGVMLGGIDMWLNTIFPSLTHTLKHSKPDYASLEKAAKAEQIDYPKPDGVLTFDILSSVFLSGTNHAEDQPVHLNSPTRASRSPRPCRNMRSPHSDIARRRSTRWSPRATG